MNLQKIIKKGYNEILTEKESIYLAESGIIETWNSRAIVSFQLYQERLCMNFSKFQEAVSKVLKRPVWTHEFAYPELLKSEFEGILSRPTFEQICDLIPKNKRILIKID